MSADPHEAALTRLIVVRHGETFWNAEARMQGQLDTSLSDRGRRQAGSVAAALADETIDAVWSSDLERARDTAEAVAAQRGLAIRTDAGLRERHFGVWQGHTYAEIGERWRDDAERWRRQEPDFAPPGGESLREFAARAVRAVERIAAAEAGRNVFVATHGGVLDHLYRAATRVGLGAARTWELSNAAINRLLHTGEGFALVGWNDVRHLGDDRPAAPATSDSADAGPRR